MNINSDCVELIISSLKRGGWLWGLGMLGRELPLQACLARLLDEEVWEKGLPWTWQICGQPPWLFWGVGAHFCIFILRGQDDIMVREQALEANIAGLKSQLCYLLVAWACINNFATLWFLHLLNRDSNDTFPPPGLLWGLSDRMHGKHLAQFQAHGKLSKCLVLLWLY